MTEHPMTEDLITGLTDGDGVVIEPQTRVAEVRRPVHGQTGVPVPASPVGAGAGDAHTTGGRQAGS